MAKKKFGKFVALATISGVIAAGISYFVKYKSFHDELDEDFHDFEGGEDFDGELPHSTDNVNRTYVSLNEKKEEAVDAIKDGAKETAEAAKETVEAAKETAEVIADHAKDMAEHVGDMANALKDNITDTAGTVKDTIREEAKDISTTIEEDISSDL